jgi:hypothetical protein
MKDHGERRGRARIAVRNDGRTGFVDGLGRFANAVRHADGGIGKRATAAEGAGEHYEPDDQRELAFHNCSE